MNKPFTVLITGTSKGLGYDLVRIFLKKHPQAIIYATSREIPTKAAERWNQIDKNNAVRCKLLEVRSDDSIHNMIKELTNEKVKLNYLINNAGVCIAEDGQGIPDVEYAKNGIGTNTTGTIRLTKALLPLLADDCRIINVSSLMGALNKQSKQIQDRFGNFQLKEEDLIKGIDEYLEAVQQKNMGPWSNHVYATSKMFLNAWSRFILQKQWLKASQKAFCVSPGFCKTPMTVGFPPLGHEYSSYSGAMRIYQTTMDQKAQPEIFYHRGREANYVSCGQGLPVDDENITE